MSHPHCVTQWSTVSVAISRTLLIVLQSCADARPRLILQPVPPYHGCDRIVGPVYSIGQRPLLIVLSPSFSAFPSLAADSPPLFQTAYSPKRHYCAFNILNRIIICFTTVFLLASFYSYTSILILCRCVLSLCVINEYVCIFSYCGQLLEHLVLPYCFFMFIVAFVHALWTNA